MMAKKEETVKKDGRKLSFTLFYYFNISQKKCPKIWKNICQKIKFLFLIFLISYCNTELKQTKTKNNCSTYGNK